MLLLIIHHINVFAWFIFTNDKRQTDHHQLYQHPAANSKQTTVMYIEYHVSLCSLISSVQKLQYQVMMVTSHKHFRTLRVLVLK